MARLADGTSWLDVSLNIIPDCGTTSMASGTASERLGVDLTLEFSLELQGSRHLLCMRLVLGCTSHGIVLEQEQEYRGWRY
jgi:hypothetical protein